MDFILARPIVRPRPAYDMWAPRGYYPCGPPASNLGVPLPDKVGLCHNITPGHLLYGALMEGYEK